MGPASCFQRGTGHTPASFSHGTRGTLTILQRSARPAAHTLSLDLSWAPMSYPGCTAVAGASQRAGPKSWASGLPPRPPLSLRGLLSVNGPLATSTPPPAKQTGHEQPKYDPELQPCPRGHTVLPPTAAQSSPTNRGAHITEIHFLRVLGAGSLKARCQPGHTPTVSPGPSPISSSLWWPLAPLDPWWCHPVSACILTVCPQVLLPATEKTRLLQGRSPSLAGKGRDLIRWITSPSWGRTGPSRQTASLVLPRTFLTDRFRLHFWGEVDTAIGLGIEPQFGDLAWHEGLDLGPVVFF